jgi:hypothetical protein
VDDHDGLPGGVPDDFDADAEMARSMADIESGRVRVPEEWELDGPAVSLSLGDACDLDPALLAAMLGPGGLGGQSLSPVFGQDEAADVLSPGPVLAALTEGVAADLAVPGGLRPAPATCRRWRSRSSAAVAPPSWRTRGRGGSRPGGGAGSSPPTSCPPSWCAP